MRRVLSVAALAAIIMMMGPAAHAQQVEGDCTVRVNGRSPVTMTEDNPLVIPRRGRVVVSGFVPESAQPSEATPTSVKVELNTVAFGWREVADETTLGTRWRGIADPPTWLYRLAAGIYEVRGVATGDGGWVCTASAYIEIDGGPLTGAGVLGAAAVIAGVVAVGRAKGSKRPPGSGVGRRDARPRHAPIADWIADLAALGVMLMVVGIVQSGAVIVVALPAGRGARRVWLSGRAFPGLIGGLAIGVGATLVLHQTSSWTFTAETLVTVPLGVAVVGAIRAWLGRPFRMTGPSPLLKDRIRAGRKRPDPVADDPMPPASDRTTDGPSAEAPGPEPETTDQSGE